MRISTLQDIGPINLRLERAENKADVRVIVPASGVATFSEAQDASNFNVDPAREEQFRKANEKPYEPAPSPPALREGDLVMCNYRGKWVKGFFIRRDVQESLRIECNHPDHPFEIKHIGDSWWGEGKWRHPTPAELAEHSK